MLKYYFLLAFSSVPSNIHKKYESLVNIDVSDVQPLSIHEEFEAFLKKDVKYLSLLQKLRFIGVETSFLWYLAPQIVFSFDDLRSEWDLQFSINALMDGALRSLFSYDKKKLIYQIKQQQQEELLKFEEILLKVIRNITEIRSKYRALVYLHQELQRKINCEHILEDDPAEEILTLQEYIYDMAGELIQAEQHLQELIIKTNFTLSKNYIKNIFKIFHVLFNSLKSYRSNIHEIKIDTNNLVNNKYKFVLKSLRIPKKPPFYFKLPFGIKMNFNLTGLSRSWQLTLNPVEYIKSIVDDTYESRLLNLEQLENHEKWRRIINDRDNSDRVEENKYATNINALKILYTLLRNEKLIQVIKIKKFIKNSIDVIQKEEEMVAHMLYKALRSRIVLLNLK